MKGTDPAMARDHLGLLLVGSTAAAGASWWLAGLTAGDLDGGRYDVALVSYTSWFLFVVFALVAGALAIAACVRPWARHRALRLNR